MKSVNIGLLGYKFMGKAHSQAYKDVQLYFNPPVVPVMKVICGREKEGVKKACKQFGWESYETDWRDLIARKDIDVIDVSTPGDVHRIQAIASAKAGKAVICEKPLANNLKDAQAMLDVVKKTKVKHMIMHNYRFIPAVALAKQMISAGELGTIYHYRAFYLQDWIVDPVK
jgi:predicted dehydrogenase